MKPRINGYTIIELLVVMTVLGILATAAMPMMELTAKRNKERELKQSLYEIRAAIDQYKKYYDAGRIAKASSMNGYPATLKVLVSGVADMNSGGQIVFFLRRIPKDPFSTEDVPADQSWGLRSFFSTADQPQPGQDVYDVYSKSTAMGMNGIPYSKW